MTKSSVQSLALCLFLIAAPVLASPDESQDKIVSEIRNLGGTVELDEIQPGRPVSQSGLPGFKPRMPCWSV